MTFKNCRKSIGRKIKSFLNQMGAPALVGAIFVFLVGQLIVNHVTHTWDMSRQAKQEFIQASNEFRSLAANYYTSIESNHSVSGRVVAGETNFELLLNNIQRQYDATLDLDSIYPNLSTESLKGELVDFRTHLSLSPSVTEIADFWERSERIAWEHNRIRESIS
ncbi:hypothetical protein FKB34_02195 [Glycocaulis profundi]|nr:hypothetical protein FKB34_02195 [Glycocaulis profundi]